MQTILPPSGNTIKILGKPKPAEHGLRWMTYVLAQPVEGGVLVFHTLTRALLLLTPEEYAAPDNLPELRDGWFRVPQEMQKFRIGSISHQKISMCLSLRTPISITAVAARASVLWQIFTS